MFGFGKALKALKAPKSTGMAYCETVYATGTSPIHIRQLTENGLFLGGGADTVAFCGLKVSWDTSALKSLENLNARIANAHPSNRTCVSCAEHATSMLEV